MNNAESLVLAGDLENPAVEYTPSLQSEVTALFDLWRNRLLAYVVTLGLSLHDGEEVVQEVFLALFEHLRRGKSDHNLRGWLFRVGHNLALKRRTAAHRFRAEAFPEDDLRQVKDAMPDPEEALAIKQRQQRLLAVVAAMPETDRCCLYLRAEGLRYREIGEVLGISLGSVASCLERSLKRLQRADGCAV